MKLDTDEYIPLAEACGLAGVSPSTGYRLASHLGIVLCFFGVKIVKRADVETMKQNRKRIGNPRWIESYEEAAEAAIKAVASREKRKKATAKTVRSRAALNGTSDAPAADSGGRRSRRAPSQ